MESYNAMLASILTISTWSKQSAQLNITTNMWGPSGGELGELYCGHN